MFEVLNDMFDFDNDGSLDTDERVMQYAMIDELIDEDDCNEDE